MGQRFNTYILIGKYYISKIADNIKYALTLWFYAQFWLGSVDLQVPIIELAKRGNF